jgi:hypothetical protein
MAQLIDQHPEMGPIFMKALPIDLLPLRDITGLL